MIEQFDWMHDCLAVLTCKVCLVFSTVKRLLHLDLDGAPCNQVESRIFGISHHLYFISKVALLVEP